jgi:hypothetical protein
MAIALALRNLNLKIVKRHSPDIPFSLRQPHAYARLSLPNSRLEPVHTISDHAYAYYETSQEICCCKCMTKDTKRVRREDTIFN